MSLEEALQPPSHSESPFPLWPPSRSGSPFPLEDMSGYGHSKYSCSVSLRSDPKVCKVIIFLLEARHSMTSYRQSVWVSILILNWDSEPIQTLATCSIYPAG